MQKSMELDADEHRTTFSREASIIADRPVLWPHLWVPYAMFQFLSPYRSSGFGPGYIPFADLILQCERYGITDCDEQDWYVQRVRILDSEYLRLVHEEEKEDEEYRKREADLQKNPPIAKRHFS